MNAFAAFFADLIVSASVGADTTTPFFSANQSPLIQVHDIPKIDTARVLKDGDMRYHWVMDLASSYTFKRSGNESVLLDGETTRLTFNYVRGLANGWEWGVQIPYVMHNPGTLDNVIVQWHDLFGFPQGGRDKVPEDRLLYRYVRNGITELELTQHTDGIGDIRLAGGWQWADEEDERLTRIALRAALSLPSGDPNQLQGSGSYDAAFWLTADQELGWFGKPGGLYGGGGVLFMGNGEVLPALQNNAALFGSVGAGMQLLPRTTFKLQGDFHTPVYGDSNLKPVSANSLQVVFGADVQLTKKTALVIAVGEDLVVSASPDVVFHLELRLTE